MRNHCIYGVYGTQGDYAWIGKKAMFHFEVPGKHDSLYLKIKYDIFTSKQSVRLYANNEKIAEFSAEGEEERTIPIPVQYIRDESLILRLEMPDAVSPKEKGVSDDARIISLALEEIAICENE